jgi:hypothetical protein
MTENRRRNWFERTFGKFGNLEKTALSMVAGALMLTGFYKGVDWYTQKQAERREFLEQRAAQEQYQDSSSFLRIPTQEDVEPEYWNARQESATNPNFSIADNFDYLPGMDDPTNSIKKSKRTKREA